MTDPALEAALSDGRRAALVLMRDTCTIERKAGERTFDPNTGQYTQAWAQVYAGVCRVKNTGGGSDSDLAGAQSVTLHRYEVRLPVDASPEVLREDRLTVTASDDAWLVGRPMEVVDVGYAGTNTARRLTVEDRS